MKVMRVARALISLSSKGMRTGQGLTEYAVVLSLIGVASIATMVFFGNALRSKIATLGSAIVGNKQHFEAARKGAETSAGQAVKEASDHTSMETTASEAFATEGSAP